MRTRPWIAAALFLGAALAATPAARAQETAKPAGFSAEQLEQLVAPIALYPDSLLTQVLIGSTYPLEVIEASRWLKKNSTLKGAALEEAVAKQDWDESVKTLCGFPEALDKMNDNLDWMQDLGDAFLGQQAQVMDAVQRMRQKALQAGTLKSTEQQTVTQTAEKIVVIEPASPQVIYVPAYAPTVVYGGWGYPSYYYPAMYLPPPPPPPGAALVTFSAGIFMGAAIGAAFDWGRHDVYVRPPPRPGGPPPRARPAPPDRPPPGGKPDRPDRPPPGDRPDRPKPPGGGDRPSPPTGGDRPSPPGGGDRPPPPSGTRPDRPTTLPAERPGSPPGDRTTWQHNPEHRKGVNYRDPAAAQKYGGKSPPPVSRDEARGRVEGARPSRPQGSGDRRPPPSQPSQAQKPTQRPPSASRPSSPPGGSRNSAYSGSRNPSMDRSSSSRGSSSRSTPSFSGSRGGGGSRPSGPPPRPSGGRGGGRGGRR